MLVFKRNLWKFLKIPKRKFSTVAINHRLNICRLKAHLIRSFCNSGIKQSKTKKRFSYKKLLLYTALTPIVFTGCGILWFTYSHRDENLIRSIIFWSSLFPIYLHYEYVQYITKDNKYTKNERDKYFNYLHEKYKYKIYNLVVKLKGFYIKLGQMRAARPDILPESWVIELRKLEDECPYEEFDVIEKIILSEYSLESLDEMFSYIDPKPLGSASIGQAHYGKLLDGSEIVIKVQYPQVEKLFRGDFLMARRFCKMAQPAHLPFLDETEKQFLTEFNYKLEAKNLLEICDNINVKTNLWNDKIKIPKPYINLCTKFCLIMEYLKGDKLIRVLKNNTKSLAKQQGLTLDEFINQQQNSSQLTAKEIDSIRSKIKLRDNIWNTLATIVNYSIGFVFQFLGHYNKNIIVDYKNSVLPLNHKQILDLVFDVHGYEIFIDGAFNGDPHPGNILLLNDLNGKYNEIKIGLIDYGQVKHLKLSERIKLAKLLCYIKDNKSELIINCMLDMGFRTKYNNPWIIETNARFFFDIDDERIMGKNMNVQLFIEYLDKTDPIVNLDDEYVMAGRVKLLMSGLYHALGYKLKASKQWEKWYTMLLNKYNIDPYIDTPPINIKLDENYKGPMELSVDTIIKDKLF